MKKNTLFELLTLFRIYFALRVMKLGTKLFVLSSLFVFKLDFIYFVVCNDKNVVYPSLKLFFLGHGNNEILSGGTQRSKTRCACQDHGYLAKSWLTMVPLSRSWLIMIHGTLVKIMARSWQDIAREMANIHLMKKSLCFFLLCGILFYLLISKEVSMRFTSTTSAKGKPKHIIRFKELLIFPTQLNMFTFLGKLGLLKCGDIESNPGPLVNFKSLTKIFHENGSKIKFFHINAQSLLKKKVNTQRNDSRPRPQ